MSRQSPEDSSNWKDMAPDVKTPVVLICRQCKKKIENWHCAESGCPWCAACGRAMEKRTK